MSTFYLLWFHARARLILPFFFFTCAIHMGALAAPLSSPSKASWPTATHIAKPRLALNNSDNSSFEAPALPANTFKKHDALTASEKLALVWTMKGDAGIARNGSSYTNKNPQQNPGAPFGSQVAYLRGSAASMQTRFTSTYGGSWRIRFYAAQRVVGSGQNLKLNQQRLRIKVNGVEVTVETPVQSIFDSNLGAYAEYVSCQFHAPIDTEQEVEFITDKSGDETVLIDQVRFERLRNWSNPGSWYQADGSTTSQDAPTVNSHVSLPTGTAMVIDSAASKAGTIHVQGELLVPDANTALTARAIMVMGQGSAFVVGKPEFPFKHNFTLTLTGGDPAKENLEDAGTNFLMAMGGGWVDMHGLKQVSWTQLSADAAANTSSLTLVDPVSWPVGAQIVIAPSIMDFETFQTEQKEIASVSANGKTITLTSPLSYKHLGKIKLFELESNTHPGVPNKVDERAEVGLLTRNVKIVGHATHGGHVMIMKGSCSACSAFGGGYARVSGVEFHQMGQKQRVGRYPFHWHMLEGEGAGQFIQNCSIRNSKNRVVVIHGTHSTLVEGNVAYDHIGHGIMLEDGSEQNNTISGNLIIGTKLPGGDPLNFATNQAVVPTDSGESTPQNRPPSAFWITHPNNRVDDNVVAGTVGTGYWLVFPTAPTGLSASVSSLNSTVPNEANLLSFKRNVAHHCMSGFDVNDGLLSSLELRKNLAWKPTVHASIQDFRAYANDVGIYAGLGGMNYDLISYDNPVLADNRRHIFLAAYQTVAEALVVADTGNSIQSAEDVRIAYRPYDGAGQLTDSHLVGFDQSNTALVADPGAGNLHPNHTFSGLTFSHTDPARIEFQDYATAAASMPVNQPAHARWFDGQEPANPSKWGIVIHDLDSSTTLRKPATNTPVYSIIGNHPIMATATSGKFTGDTNWSNGLNAKLSQKKFSHLRLYYDGLKRETLPDVTITRSGGPGPQAEVTLVNLFKASPFHQMPVIVTAGAPFNYEPFAYKCLLKAQPKTKKMQVWHDDADVGDVSPIITVAWPNMAVDKISVEVPKGQGSWTAYASLDALNKGNTSGYFKDTFGKQIHLRFVQTATMNRAILEW